MHSVTSSAVAARFEKFDYSENEVNTGRKWIDGSLIYRKVVYIGNATLGSSNNFPHNIQNLGTVIKLARHFVYSNTQYMMWDGSPTMTVNNTNIAVSGASSLSVTKLYFIIEYTKNN